MMNKGERLFKVACPLYLLYQDALAYAKDKVAKLQEQGSSEQNLKYAIKDLQAEQFERSRLFAVDADTDATALRAKYRDKATYIIAKGLITVKYTKKAVRAYVSNLSIKNIYVPLKHSGFLKTLQPARKTNNGAIIKPRYSVTLKYGTRFEPYITAVKQIKTRNHKIPTTTPTLPK
jgi:ribosomal protein S8